jgi:hypothetical protein
LITALGHSRSEATLFVINLTLSARTVDAHFGSLSHDGNVAFHDRFRELEIQTEETGWCREGESNPQDPKVGGF